MFFHMYYRKVVVSLALVRSILRVEIYTFSN